MTVLRRYDDIYAAVPYWQFMSGVFSRARDLKSHCRRRQILSFLIDSLARPTRRAEWFAYVDTQLPSGVPSRTATHVVTHTARRYLRYWLSPQARIDILRDHYDILGERFSPALLDAMQAASGSLLGELVGKSGRIYSATLHYAMTKEGEIEIRINDLDLGVKLATIRGTFGRHADGRWVFWVGAIQGAPRQVGREEICRATRDLNVLRPKQVVLHAACALCASIGVETLFLPSNKNHVARGWWRRWVLTDKILSDYDGFWQEFTTQRTTWGDYRLCLPLPRRRLEDVPSKRRKDWLRRHAQLDALAIEIAAIFDAPGYPLEATAAAPEMAPARSRHDAPASRDRASPSQLSMAHTSIG
jgi:uncharacterized protein VirK/YbjX